MDGLSPEGLLRLRDDLAQDLFDQHCAAAKIQSFPLSMHRGKQESWRRRADALMGRINLAMGAAYHAGERAGRAKGECDHDPAVCAWRKALATKEGPS